MDEDTRLLVDLHLGGERQGPGEGAATRRAVDLAGLRDRRALRLADVGCGTGAATLTLAAELDAEILAVDFAAPFLNKLSARMTEAGFAERVTPVLASMEAMPIEPGSLDAIWSEGAIYNIGFEAGARLWRPLLKPGGVLAVSELTWLTASRPEPLQAHWEAEYPEVGLASEKIAALERSGYAPLGYFPLPRRCWEENYHRPLEARFDAFLARQGRSEAAQRIVAAERREIDLYRRYAEFVGYGYYIAARTDAAA